MATLSSGREVEKPTRMKPIVVFPKPVMSETLTEFLIDISLPMTKSRIDTSKMSALAANPNCPNISVSPSLSCLRNAPYNIYERSNNSEVKRFGDCSGAVLSISFLCVLKGAKRVFPGLMRCFS